MSRGDIFSVMRFGLLVVIGFPSQNYLTPSPIDKPRSIDCFAPPLHPPSLFQHPRALHFIPRVCQPGVLLNPRPHDCRPGVLLNPLPPCPSVHLLMPQPSALIPKPSCPHPSPLIPKPTLMPSCQVVATTRSQLPSFLSSQGELRDACQVMFQRADEQLPEGAVDGRPHATTLVHHMLLPVCPCTTCYCPCAPHATALASHATAPVHHMLLPLCTTCYCPCA